MTLGLICKKIGMTRLYDEAGAIVPVTVLEAGPCPILQVKTDQSDGYRAVQLGYGARAANRVNKPMQGHFKKSGTPPQRIVREFRVDSTEEFAVGSELNVEIFEAGERVDVIGTSKGRGFAGTIKRHHTSRGPESHGSHYHRRPGSMGASSDPSRVWKGKKLPGRLGGKRITTQGLTVVKIDKERNLLLVRGSVPGHNNATVLITKTKKTKKGAGTATGRS